MNTQRQTESGEPGFEDAATPDWLEMLLAKYGEETPSLSLSPPAIVEEEPLSARPGSREIIGGADRTVAAAEPDELPDWLGSLRGGGSVEEKEAPVLPDQQPVQGDEAVGLPETDATQAASWLSRLESVSSDHATPAVVHPRAAAEDVPDWLAASLEQAEVLEARQPDTPSVAAPLETKDDKEVPDWLARLGDVSTSPAAGTPMSVEEAGALPDETIRSVERDEPGMSESVKPARPTAPPPAIREPVAVIEDSYDETGWDAPPAIIDTGELKSRQSEMPGETRMPPPPIRQEKEAVPDWLAQLISTQAETPIPAPEEEPEQEAEEGHETVGIAGDTARASERGAARAVVEIPPWLAELNVSELETLEPGDSEMPEIPVSLEEMDREGAKRQPGAVPAPMQLPESPPAVETGLTSAAARSVQVPEEDAGESLPGWLSQLQSLDETRSAPSAVVPPELVEPPAVSVEAKDDWISDLESMGTGTETLTAGAEKLPAGEEEQVPDWLRDMRTEVPGGGKVDDYPLSEGAPVVNHGLEQAAIPQWMLKLKPETTLRGGGKEQVPGLPDVLPVAEDIGDEETFTSLRARLSVPEVPDVEGASLFRRIASDAAESSPTADEKSKGSQWFATLVWVLVFVILIVAIAVTLMAVLSRAETMLGAPAFQEYLNSPGAVGLVGSVQGFRAEIAALPEDSVVLVCFDYSPATEAEMGLLAGVILDDLFQHQLRVMAVSLSPEGAMMAHRLIGHVSEKYPEGQAINLGYLPGNAAGIRSLTSLKELTTFDGEQRLSTTAGWEDVDELADVALAVDIADNNNTVRWWVEQQQVLGLTDQPLLAAVSASSAPASRPYREANLIDCGHLEELISGVTAAAAYEFYLGEPGRAMKGLAAQSVAHLGLVLVAMAGTIAGFRHQ